MPRRLIEQQMTLSGLEWLFHGSSIPSVREGHAPPKETVQTNRETAVLSTFAVHHANQNGYKHIHQHIPKGHPLAMALNDTGM